MVDGGIHCRLNSEDEENQNLNLDASDDAWTVYLLRNGAALRMTKACITALLIYRFIDFEKKKAFDSVQDG